MKMNMKKILTIIGAALLMLTAWSCREQSDQLMAYDQNEDLVFGDAEKSFAAKFQVLWNGMSQYYALWDFEKEQGVDWDAIYDEYYPQFQALDQKDKVTDDELTALLKKVFDPLHDGHLSFSVTNHTTGSTVACQPEMDRVKQRVDFEQSSVQPSLAYYANVANGKVETDDNGNPIVLEHSTDPQVLITEITQVPGKGIPWVKAKIQELQAKSSRTEMEDFQLQQLNDLMEKLKEAASNPQAVPLINALNTLQAQYSFLNIPGFDYIDPAFATGQGISVKYALLKDGTKHNIAYFRLSAFFLTSYLEDKECQSLFNMSNASTQQHVKAIREVWQAWFNDVQRLHKEGTLGGVIIDVRSNGGGDMNDSKYVVGALVPGDYITFGYQRFKRGTGRFEYSTLMPAHVKTMSDPHETITEPIVILTNCQSVSMSETSTLCVKTLPNGKQIGKRSFGAICALTGNDKHSFNYAGYIGVEGVTPVFGHVPSMASFTLQKTLVESTGIVPDIEVDLDLTQFSATGRDTQLDRALQFFSTGN